MQTLDRKTGIFTHYYYDSLHPEKLSRPPLVYYKGESIDHIAFITEDPKGGIVIGTHVQGINYYDPTTQKVTHYGYLVDKNAQNYIATDTSTGLTTTSLWRSFTSKDGLIWIITLNEGVVYTINPYQIYLPYYTLNERKPDVNSLYCEPNGFTLWIGTDEGLVRKDLRTGKQTVIKHNIANANSLSNDTVVSVKADSEGKLWIGTANGLCKYDPVTNNFRNYHNEKNTNSLSSNSINYLFFDHENFAQECRKGKSGLLLVCNR